jgi:hypothetical protein
MSGVVTTLFITMTLLFLGCKRLHDDDEVILPFMTHIGFAFAIASALAHVL